VKARGKIVLGSAGPKPDINCNGVEKEIFPDPSAKIMKEIVSGDEIWVFQYDKETQCQTLQ
jgi:hypothetical protein